MHYVYLLRSRSFPSERYVGLTADVEQRLKIHNRGGSPHTAKFKPWELITLIAFPSRAKAAAFESYLKSGSGRAFAIRRLKA